MLKDDCRPQLKIPPVLLMRAYMCLASWFQLFRLCTVKLPYWGDETAQKGSLSIIINIVTEFRPPNARESTSSRVVPVCWIDGRSQFLIQETEAAGAEPGGRSFRQNWETTPEECAGAVSCKRYSGLMQRTRTTSLLTSLHLSVCSHATICEQLNGFCHRGAFTNTFHFRLKSDNSSGHCPQTCVRFCAQIERSSPNIYQSQDYFWQRIENVDHASSTSCSSRDN
jgi:hypothetical protein